MKEILDLFIGIHFNKYCFLPSIFAGTIFSLQICQRKNQFDILTSLADIFTVFSLTLSTEYLVIFLLLGSLPGQIDISDKAIIFIGLIFVNVSVLNNCAKGTTLGNVTSKIIKKFSHPEAVIEPALSFQKEINGLEKSLKLLNSNNYKKNGEAFDLFASHGQATLIKFQNCSQDKDEEVKNLEEKYKECKQKINIAMTSKSEESRLDAHVALSEFKGRIEGLNVLIESSYTHTTDTYQSSGETSYFR